VSDKLVSLPLLTAAILAVGVTTGVQGGPWPIIGILGCCAAALLLQRGGEVDVETDKVKVHVKTADMDDKSSTEGADKGQNGDDNER